MDVQLSEYAKQLPSEARDRYVEKIAKIDFEDPYLKNNASFSTNIDLLPKTTYPDIVNYLIFAPSPITGEELKSYKSLDAYHHFVSGFVKSVGTIQYGEICLIYGRVLHSMKLSLPPAKAWLIIESSGRVISAHCDCTAGMGESCSHVGASLFYIDAINKLKDSTTVTGEKAYWVPPPGALPEQFEVGYSEIADINFTNPETKKKKMEKIMCGGASATPKKAVVVNKYLDLAPSDNKLHAFFHNLSLAKSKPAVLSIVQPYSTSYKPKSTADIYPSILTNLYDPKFIDLNYMELLQKAREINLVVTPDQQQAVEEATREQANSCVWFRFRSGRITASKMFTTIHTNMNMPAVSLIKSVCYPQKISAEPANWGCDHEKGALKVYKEYMEKKHKNFKITPSGLFISTQFPFIGATPDSLVSCDCCGNGCVEVKCP